MSNSKLIKVAIHGAAGKIGVELLKAIHVSPDMKLVAAIDQLPYAQAPPMPEGVNYYSDAESAFLESKVDVVVDFTNGEASFQMVPHALKAGISPVIGSTGLSETQLTSIDKMCKKYGIGGFHAPNFTIGAILLQKIASLVAPYFHYVDIFEEHHEAKLDSPSGTAMAIAKSIRDTVPDGFKNNVSQQETLPGSRGANFDGISIHSSRLPGRMAHHQVTFGSLGQTLTIRHDTINRECYMAGVLLAVRKVHEWKGLKIGLDSLLDLKEQ